MTPAEALVVLALLAWFTLSVIQQFGPRWFERVRDWDVFGLLPLWTFFAPNPGHSDYHLVYRDRSPDGSLTPWHEVPTAQARTHWTWLWNPEKRSKKVLADVAAVLADYRNLEIEPDDLMLSLPYLVLLNVVDGIDAEPRGSRQFAVVETFGFEAATPMRALLVSDFHASDATP